MELRQRQFLKLPDGSNVQPRLRKKLLLKEVRTFIVGKWLLLTILDDAFQEYFQVKRCRDTKKSAFTTFF